MFAVDCVHCSLCILQSTQLQSSPLCWSPSPPISDCWRPASGRFRPTGACRNLPAILGTLGGAGKVTLHFTQNCLLYFTLLSLSCTLHCKLSTASFTLYTVQCTLYTVHCTLYTVHCTLYTVHCTLYNVQCTLYTVYCKLYTLNCILYTVYYLHPVLYTE